MLSLAVVASKGGRVFIRYLCNSFFLKKVFFRFLLGIYFLFCFFLKRYLSGITKVFKRYLPEKIFWFFFLNTFFFRYLFGI